jgi:hypothetical protein
MGKGRLARAGPFLINPPLLIQIGPTKPRHYWELGGSREVESLS